MRLTLLDQNFSSYTKSVVSDSIHAVEADVNTFDAHNAKFDWVIHAAGIASPYYYRAHPVETLNVAVNGTQNMLRIAQDAGARFVFFSSSEIYGDPDSAHVPTPESYRGNVACQGPRACYDESKRLGETLCYIWHENFGVHTNTIRPFNVFGPGMSENDYRVLPSIASALKGKRRFKAYGTGQQTRTYTFITDALTGFFRVFARGVAGEAYNIGNSQPEVSVLELIQITRDELGRDLKFDVIEHPDSYPADEPQRRCPDIRKAREQLGFNPQVRLSDGLTSFFAWTEDYYTGRQ
jgi:UDP-glucuronate decarboxylase